MTDKYVLVTGCAGLLGSRMCDWISENKKDYGIIGVDSLFGGYIENINNDVIFFQLLPLAWNLAKSAIVRSIINKVPAISWDFVFTVIVTSCKQ